MKLTLIGLVAGVIVIVLLAVGILKLTDRARKWIDRGE